MSYQLNLIQIWKFKLELFYKMWWIGSDEWRRIAETHSFGRRPSESSGAHLAFLWFRFLRIHILSNSNWNILRDKSNLIFSQQSFLHNACAWWLLMLSVSLESWWKIRIHFAHFNVLRTKLAIGFSNFSRSIQNNNIAKSGIIIDRWRKQSIV